MSRNDDEFLAKDYKIRNICTKDDAVIAKIIRTNLQR